MNTNRMSELFDWFNLATAASLLYVLIVLVK